jgi:four helix bundle protein
MSDLKDFEDMKVWQDAQALAFEVYKDFQNSKDFSFKDQITRAAVSISNNIAEGAERSTSTEFSRFLDIAKGSTGEVRSMYRLAQRLNLLSLETVEHRSALCVEISEQLAGFAKYLRAK